MAADLDDFSGGKQISKYGVANNFAAWWIGTVVDVNDPKKMGRVKVHIVGTHSLSPEDIPPDFLPWAQVSIPTTEGGSSGIGNVVGLKPKAQVFGLFLDGNQQLPIVLGSIPKIEIPENMDAPEITKDRDPELGDALEDSRTESAKINDKNNPVTNVSPDIPNESKSNNIDDKLVGRSNAEKAFHYFISPHGLSLTPNQACAIVGNFFQESGKDFGNGQFDIDPTAISSFKDEGSIGIAQWNPSAAAGNRAGQLKEYANELKLSWDSLLAQLRFTKKELVEVSYFGLSKLRNTKTIEEATKVFCFKYERPNKKYAHLDSRVKYARSLQDRLDSRTAQVVEKRPQINASSTVDPDRVRKLEEAIT